mmetsp:Transcript_55967/g.132034  ORF Transcript_55967/g.132034 Transcript_55967/m.132034 type:complete len:229 (-) Transcript_55967:108-794(-)
MISWTRKTDFSGRWEERCYKKQRNSRLLAAAQQWRGNGMPQGLTIECLRLKICLSPLLSTPRTLSASGCCARWVGERAMVWARAFARTARCPRRRSLLSSMRWMSRKMINLAPKKTPLRLRLRRLRLRRRLARGWRRRRKPPRKLGRRRKRRRKRGLETRSSRQLGGVQLKRGISREVSCMVRRCRLQILRLSGSERRTRRTHTPWPSPLLPKMCKPYSSTPKTTCSV